MKQDAGKLTAASVRELLRVDTVSLRDGVYTARRQFFYRMGGTPEQLEARVRQVLPGATVLSSGEVWKRFNGGASVRNSSHWYVTFTLPGGRP